MVLIDVLDDLIKSSNELVLTKKKVYIYGTGFCGKWIYMYLKGLKCNVTAFAQTKVSAKEIFGVEVIDIWELCRQVKGEDDYICLIAVQNKYRDEIATCLSGLGITEFVQFDFKRIAKDAVKDNYADFWNKFDIYNNLGDAESKVTYQYGCAAKLSCDISYYLDLHMSPCISSYITDNHVEGFGRVDDWVKRGGHRANHDILLYVPNMRWLKFLMPRVNEMGLKVKAICTDDASLIGRILYKKVVISIKDAAQIHSGSYILIGCTMNGLKESSVEEMLSNGIRREHILLSYSKLNPFVLGKQYFDLPYLKLTSDEIFVDAGGFDGQTVANFIEEVHGQYRHIYTFEPDKKSFARCQAFAEEHNIENYTIIPKGLWSGNGELSFSSDGTALSRIEQGGIDTIQVAALDESISGEVTYIKMDIEGAEYNALTGAEEIIKKYKPKLAISIYHKAADFIDIPDILLNWVPEYKFYIRHYSLYKYETVLYAFVDENK